MDDHSACAQQNGFHLNGLLPEEAASVTRPIDPKRWARAEERTAELISRIQPNWTSEKHRNAVASYVQRLIGNCVPCQVFTFGSVPLRTYLPDGDIDLTTFSEDHNVKDNWANNVLDMLRREEKNVHSEFQVQEVQYIQAQVKVIKCLVGNIVVDISFNQLGGLCTLCFLEEVDNLINQNHLFKRSIILIKAWCYYESRILGAHHGLISTYALETLVLYIFHVFNNSFAGPLEVLFRFVEFFSKFDWANFCVSLRGPIPICSLPSMEADPPRQDGAELLLNKMFLNACSKAYSVFRGSEDYQEHPFTSKHFNVVDPLRLNNNLGRSVSKGNFYRIRSAFSFGAQKLARILECKEENIVAEVNQFFVNTWDRHGKGCRPDVPILDYFHIGHADSEHERNCRKNTLSENPTANSTSQFPQIGDSHKSMDFMMQPHNFPVNQIAGWDQNFIQRMNPTKKQQSETETISRAHLLQIRRHATPQLARTSSSPELTSMSGGTVSLRRHNAAPGRVKEVITSSSESHLSHCIPESNQSFGCHASRPVSSSTKPEDEWSHKKQQEQDFMNLHMPVDLASLPFVSISPSVGTQIYFDGPPLAPYQQYNHVESTPEVEIMGELHGEAVSLKADHLNDDHSFWTDSNVEPLKKIEHDREEFSTVSPRISPLSPGNSYGTMESSESCWERKSSKVNNAMKFSMTKSLSSTKKQSAAVDNREEEGESVCHIYDGVNERSSSPYVSSSHGEFHQLPGFGKAHMRYPNSVLPIAPLLVRPGSQQGVKHNNAVFPVAFYPNGLVPFVTMVPVYNPTAETRAARAPANRDEIEMEKPTVDDSQSSHSLDSTNEVMQLTHKDSFGSTKKTTPKEQPNESEPDIFNSDFTSHWKNLQYGRFCQTSQLQYPFTNPPTVMVPPSQLQGNIPFDAPRSPHPRTSNVFAPFVPVATQKPSPSKSGGVSRQYSGEFPKHRNGTGTYFPNPEVIRDRQFVTSRQYQVEPKHDRNDYHGEREANWNFSSKPRVSGRGHPRYRHDKRNSKTDRSVASSSQSDKSTFQKNSSDQLYHFEDPPTPKSTWNEHYDGDYMVYQSRSDFRDECL